MRNAPGYVFAFLVLTCLAAAALVLGPKPVEADQNKTTEEAAFAAGAKVAPTASGLRVEPKGYRP